MGNLSGLMQQAQKMQRDLQRLQAELKERMVEGSAADGAIKVIASGDQRVMSVRLDSSVVDPDDTETLEDLLIIAVNSALDKARQLQKDETEKVTGGLNIPGMF
ncbi:MAG: YbaB/EbfC family nucleoid-associated protein [Planctomycetes bacterium]|nr:YbaB/EbfC family nucleoid-associated protein [Planctomycetota bacterium]